MTWKSGQSGNPKGREKVIDQALLDEVKSDRESIRALVRQFMRMKQVDLLLVAENPDASYAEILLAQLMERAHTDADVVRARFLLEIGYGDMTKPEAPQLTAEQQAVLDLFEKWKGRNAIEDQGGES